MGNWVDEHLLNDRTFDVVLLDYLVGAVDRFAPYYQSRLLGRLRRHVKERVYVIGLEPYGDADASLDSQLITRIANLRDACHLLTQDRPHREYPRWWMVEELQRRGYQIVSQRSFPIQYGRSFVEEELNVCRRAISRAPKDLQKALSLHEKKLRDEAFKHINRGGALSWGSDYVIEAAPFPKSVDCEPEES